MTSRSCAVPFVLLLVAGCGRKPPRPQAVTAESVQGNETAFTAVRPLPPHATIDSLREVTVRSGTPTDTGLTLRLIYDGSPARVVITTPDGRVISDTTHPRDESCDNFRSPPGEDGIGCLPDEFGTNVPNTPPGTAYLQFTGTDTGVVGFEMEIVRGRTSEGYWNGFSFRLKRGETQIFRVTVPPRRGGVRLDAVPITSPVDTVTPRVDPDTARG